MIEEARLLVGIRLPHYEFLEALNDPSHEGHQAMLEWCGGSFDPAAVDLDEVNQRLSEVKL